MGSLYFLQRSSQNYDFNFNNSDIDTINRRYQETLKTNYQLIDKILKENNFNI